MNLNEITSIIGFNVKTFVTKDAVPQIINNQKLIGALILSSELGDDSIVPYIVLNNGRTRRLDGGTYQYLQNINGSLKNAYDNFTDWSHLIETTYSYSLDILSKSSQVVDEATNKITYFEESTNQFYRDTNNTVSELTTKVNDTYNNIYDISNSIIAQTSYSVNAAIENSKYIYNPITYTYELLDYSLANLAIQSDKIRTDVNNRVNELSGYVTDYTTYITQTAGTISNVAKQVNEYYNDYTNSYNVVRSQIGALNVSYNNISAYVFDSYAYSISKLNQTATYLNASINSLDTYLTSFVELTSNNILTYVQDSYAYSISKLNQTATDIKAYVESNYRKNGVKITSSDLQIGDITDFDTWVNGMETDLSKVSTLQYSYVYSDTLQTTDQSYTPILNNRVVVGFKTDMINVTDKFTNATLSANAILSNGATTAIPANNCVISNNFKTITVNYDGNGLVSDMQNNPIIGVQILYKGNDNSILYDYFIHATVRSGALITVNTAIGKIDSRTAGFDTLNNSFNTFYSTYNVTLGQFKDAWDVSANKTTTWHETDPDSPSNPFTYVFNSVGNLQVKSDSITATVDSNFQTLSNDLFSPNLLTINNVCDVYWKFIVPSDVNEYYTKDITETPYTRALYMPHLYMKSGKKYTISFYVDKTLYLKYPGNTTEWQNALTENITTNTTGIPVWQLIAKVSNVDNDNIANWNNHTTLFSQYIGTTVDEIDTTDYYTNKNIVRVHYTIEIPASIDVNGDSTVDNIDGCYVQFALISTNSDISIYRPKIEQNDKATKYSAGGVNHITTINQTSTQISAYVKTLTDTINETRLDILNSNINAYADSFNFYSSLKGDTDATLEANKIGFISSNDGIVISKGKFSGEVNASKFIAGGNGSLHTVVTGDRFEFYSDKVSDSIKSINGDNVFGNYGVNNYDWPAAYFFYSEIDSKPQLNLCLWGATIGAGEYRVIDLEKATMPASGYVTVQINSGTLSLYANPQTQTTTEIWWNGGSNPDLSTTAFYQDSKIGTTAQLLVSGTKFYKKIKTYNAALSKLNFYPVANFTGMASFDYTQTGTGQFQSNASSLYGSAGSTTNTVEYRKYMGNFTGTSIPINTPTPDQDITTFVTNNVEQYAVYQVNSSGNIINTNKYIYIYTTSNSFATSDSIRNFIYANSTTDNPIIYSEVRIDLYTDNALQVSSATSRTIIKVNTYDVTNKNVYSVKQNASYNILNNLTFGKTSTDVTNIATQYMSDKTLSSLMTPTNYWDYDSVDTTFTKNLNTIVGGNIATVSKDSDWVNNPISVSSKNYYINAVYNWTYSSYTNTWPGSFVYNGETIYSAMQKALFAPNSTIKAMNTINICDVAGTLDNAETTNVLTEVN